VVFCFTTHYDDPSGARTLKSLYGFRLKICRIDQAPYTLLSKIRIAKTSISTKIDIPERNATIKARYQEGETLSDLARVYGISPQRIYQIVNGKNK